MALKGLTKDGTLIDAGAEGAAFAVDPSEDGADKFIENVRRKHLLETVNLGAAHEAVDGHAVPVSIDDTVSPQEKLQQLQSEGLIKTGETIQTSQGAKSAAEIGNSGLDVDPNKTPGDGENGNGENKDETPVEHTAEQKELIELIGEKPAKALFAEGLTTREAIVAKTETQLISYRDIGPATAKNILAVLA